MAVQEKPMTAEQFWETSQQSEYQNKQLELINGEMIVMSPSSARNSEIALTVGIILGTFIREKKLGRITTADGGYHITESTILVPDFGFIRAERVPEGDFVFYSVPPDLAVEVISPSETHPSVQRKTRLYLEAGVQAVWNILPETETIDVVTLGAGNTLITKTYAPDDDIPGGAVIPGFSVKVAVFFNY